MRLEPFVPPPPGVSALSSVRLDGLAREKVRHLAVPVVLPKGSGRPGCRPEEIERDGEEGLRHAQQGRHPMPDAKFGNLVSLLHRRAVELPDPGGVVNGRVELRPSLPRLREPPVEGIIERLDRLVHMERIWGFEFADELFNFNEGWVLEFCNALDREGLDIYYRVLGARVDRINERILQRLKDTCCVDINYGQESGSDTILKEYREGVSREKNTEITMLTKDVGVICPVQIVIGDPGETPETIDQTIRFLQDVHAGNPSVNYLLAFPCTPVWQYVTDNGLIPDVEMYLDRVAEEAAGSPIVNLTHFPDRIWRS